MDIYFQYSKTKQKQTFETPELVYNNLQPFAGYKPLRPKNDNIRTISNLYMAF